MSGWQPPPLEDYDVLVDARELVVRIRKLREQQARARRKRKKAVSK